MALPRPRSRPTVGSKPFVFRLLSGRPGTSAPKTGRCVRACFVTLRNTSGTAGLAIYWQRDAEAGPAQRRDAGDDAAVVKDDDLLHEREAEARAAALVREKGTENLLALRGRNAGPVVVHGDLRHLLRAIDFRLDDDSRRDGPAGAGFEGVAQQVAERLPQQHL